MWGCPKWLETGAVGCKVVMDGLEVDIFIAAVTDVEGGGGKVHRARITWADWGGVVQVWSAVLCEIIANIDEVKVKWLGLAGGGEVDGDGEGCGFQIGSVALSISANGE